MWGSELTSKDAALQGGPAETAARLNVKLWTSVVVTGDWCYLTAFSTRKLKAATRKLKADEKRTHSRAFAFVGLCFCTSLLAARCPARGMLGRVLYAAAFFLFLISAATAGGRKTVQTTSAAAKTLPTTPTHER